MGWRLELGSRVGAGLVEMLARGWPLRHLGAPGKSHGGG